MKKLRVLTTLSTSLLILCASASNAASTNPCPSGESQLIVNYNAKLATGLLFSTYGINTPLLQLKNNASFLNTHYKWLSHSTKQWKICLPNNNSQIQYIFNGATNQLHFWMFANTSTTININSKGTFGLSTKAVGPDQSVIKITAANITSLNDLTAENINNTIQSAPNYKAGHPIELDITLTGDETLTQSAQVPSYTNLNYPVTKIVISSPKGTAVNITDNITSQQANKEISPLILNSGNSPKLEIDNLKLTANSNVSTALESNAGGVIFAKNDTFSNFGTTLSSKNSFLNIGKDTTSIVYVANSTFNLSAQEQNSTIVLGDSNADEKPFGSMVLLENPSINITENNSGQITLLHSSYQGISALNVDYRTDKLNNPNYFYLKNSDANRMTLIKPLFSVDNMGIVAVRDHQFLGKMVGNNTPDGEYGKFMAPISAQLKSSLGIVLSANGSGSVAVMDTNDSQLSSSTTATSASNLGVAAINPVKKLIAKTITAIISGNLPL